MNILLAILFLQTVGLSALLNRDLFSPAKLFIASVGVVFFDVFLSPYSVPVVAVFLGILAMIVLLTLWEVQSDPGPPHNGGAGAPSGRYGSRSGAVALILWAATAVPVAAQVALIYFEGGLRAYINVLQIRVTAFRGLGYLLSLTAIIYPINLFYFGFGLISRPRRRWWVGYVCHLAIQIALALLSSSRALVVLPLAQLAMTYNFLRRPVRMATAAALGVLLLVIVALIGAAREGYAVTSDGQFRTGLDRGFFNLEHFKYGLMPLDLVFTHEIVDPKYGMTFATVVTNYVPRVIWPDKPDAGGVVITRELLNDRWHGQTYLAPGLIAESILNFGRTGGLIFGFAAFTAAMALLTRLYGAIRRRTISPTSGDMQIVLRYVTMSLPVVSLVSGEFTNCMIPMINSLLVLGLLKLTVSQFLRVDRSSSK